MEIWKCVPLVLLKLKHSYHPIIISFISFSMNNLEKLKCIFKLYQYFRRGISHPLPLPFLTQKHLS